MIAGALLDYHFPSWWPPTIARIAPSVVIRCVGGDDAPVFNAKDPEILLRLESRQFILVTNNRRSMPVHLANHLAQGRHVQGIFVTDQKHEIHNLSEQLELIIGASFPDEFQDQIRFLPLW